MADPRLCTRETADPCSGRYANHLGAKLDEATTQNSARVGRVAVNVSRAIGLQRTRQESSVVTNNLSRSRDSISSMHPTRCWVGASLSARSAPKFVCPPVLQGVPRREPKQGRMAPMAAEPALVTPSLLEWARTSMNIDVESAAKRAGVKPDRLREWEAATGHPSIPQARRLAAVYKRPLAALFLPAPPRDFTIPHDFRRLPDTPVAVASPRLVEAIRVAEYRRSTAIELSDPDEGRTDLLGIGSVDENPEAVAGRVRERCSGSLSRRNEAGVTSTTR